jgi:hypothetical protein
VSIIERAMFSPLRASTTFAGGAVQTQKIPVGSRWISVSSVAIAGVGSASR